MTPSARRSILGLGALALAAASRPARAAPIPNERDGFRMGIVNWKSYTAPAEDFWYAPGMFPDSQHIDGWKCSNFACGQTFTKLYDDTYLWGGLFGDLVPPDCNSCFTGIWLTAPGTTKPYNAASIAINGQRGQDMTYCISDLRLAGPSRRCGKHPAGVWGTQVFVTRYYGSEPCRWIMAGATQMEIFEIRLPDPQTR
jgi:hypothetical protein